MPQMVDEIIYHLDSPSPEALVEAQRLNVQGWVACSPARRIAEVSIATRTGRQPLSLADRPDVVASVPHLNSTGFEGQVEPDGLAAPITIFFRFENGTLEQRSLSLRVSQESDEDFERRKAAKLARIAAILSCPHCKTSITTQATNPSIACACCGNSYRRERYALDFSDRRTSSSRKGLSRRGGVVKRVRSRNDRNDLSAPRRAGS